MSVRKVEEVRDHAMQQTTPIQTDLIVAQPLAANDGYTWTLASRLGEMLHRAEQLYGARDASYTILGFEFGAGVPHIWYPGNRRHIVIQLTLECLTDLRRACYQLAHECVHVLAPTGGQTANVLEEGLASHFSELYFQDTFAATMPSDLQSYADACGSVRQLLAIDQTIIRTLRSTQPAFHLVTADNILALRTDVPRPLAESLVVPFVR
jgi:hypothetical protein